LEKGRDIGEFAGFLGEFGGGRRRSGGVDHDFQ
jgi:hypothetical protein